MTLNKAIKGKSSQLGPIREATELVTGALGINDMQFSDVGLWLGACLDSRGCVLYAASRAAELSSDLDSLFAALSQAKGQVVVTLYYNPYDSGKDGCGELSSIAGAIVFALNSQLEMRARKAGFRIADLEDVFAGKGAGRKGSYVFGFRCDIDGALSGEIPPWVSDETIIANSVDAYVSGSYSNATQRLVQTAFDPHPNAAGSRAIAKAIIAAIK